MTWPSVLIVFVSLFMIFNSINPPSPATKTTPTISPEHVASPTADYQIVSANIYQTIVSYIMDYNKSITITEVIAIAEAAVNFGIENNVDPLLLTAQMSAESSFNRMAVSSSGARGLGQMMPFNFDTYGITDPHDINQGVRAQAMKMRWLLDMWNGSMNYALASYYQGQNAIKANQGNPFRVDTQQYVDKILSRYEKLKSYS